MNKRQAILAGIALVLGVIAAYFHPATQEQLAYLTMPDPVERTVSWTEDVKPVMDKHCVRCHAAKVSKGKFQYDTRETFLAGGKSGPVAISGDSRESLIVKAVIAFPGAPTMPRGGGERLSAEEVGILRAWIDQGLNFD